MNVIAGPTYTPGSAPDFDTLARVYRWMEWLSFGPILRWCRCEFLSSLNGCRHALVFGDGDGRFTARLLNRNKVVTVDAVDASEAMLRSLKTRAGKNISRLQTQCIDARNWQANGDGYDLVITHFFLDCLTSDEVLALATRVRAAAIPGAMWVISEFAIPQKGFGRLFARLVVAVLYLAFGWLTGLRVRQLPAYSQALIKSGFVIRQRKTQLAGLLVSELWECSAL